MSMILKRKDFARWQSAEKLPDSAVCKAVKEMENGLIDTDLGGMLYKKRIARSGSGKSGGFRTLQSARVGDRYVFLHGFAKSNRTKSTQDERRPFNTLVEFPWSCQHVSCPRRWNLGYY